MVSRHATLSDLRSDPASSVARSDAVELNRLRPRVAPDLSVSLHPQSAAIGELCQLTPVNFTSKSGELCARSSSISLQHYHSLTWVIP
jgi:hypothetical protein